MLCTLIGTGRSVENLELLQESLANAHKHVIDGIDSTSTRRGHITKCVRGLR